MPGNNSSGAWLNRSYTNAPPLTVILSAAMPVMLAKASDDIAMAALPEPEPAAFAVNNRPICADIAPTTPQLVSPILVIIYCSPGTNCPAGIAVPVNPPPCTAVSTTTAMFEVTCGLSNPVINLDNTLGTMLAVGL